MKQLHGVLLLATLALIALVAGCAVDQATGPANLPAPGLHLASPASDAVVGPSEIVLALDMSDSVGTDDLSMEIMGLKACLQDPVLFPADGSVSVAIVVYGDSSTADVVGTLTPVTPQSWADVFQPALDSLLVDRLVPTSGADLAGAMQAAGAILSTGSAGDHHVLLVGSGWADDPDAARQACSQLQGEGVMISALDLGGGDLFGECSQGGYYEAVAEGDILPCEHAFSYMLLVRLKAAPESAQLAPGEKHTVVAKVFRGSDDQAFPIEGLTIDFAVTGGPNQGLSASTPSDSLGVALFTYTGSAGAGVDTIQVSALHPGTQVAMVDTVTVEWMNNPPVCDAGGPYTAVVDADTVQVQLDGSASSDADGDSLLYQWFVDVDGAVLDDATRVDPILTLTGAALCADSVMVRLQVSDATDTSSCAAEIVIDDQRPPVLVAADPYLLWPPNHKLQTITPEMLITTAEDACGAPVDLSGIEIVEVRSSEPVNDRGDGNTEPDVFITCPNGLQLRAERAGGGHSRVYTVVYRYTDEQGAVTELETHVVVPHDQGHGSIFDLDAPAAYVVVGDCGNTRDPR